MAYEFERDEWRSAIRSMTEHDRQITADQPRQALGIVGDITDAIHDHCGSTDDDGDGDG